MTLLHCLPVQSREQAVTLEEGQEIVGTRRVTAASVTSWRKLRPQNNARKHSEQQRRGAKKRERKPENNDGVDVTPRPDSGLGGNPEVCCAGAGARFAQTH